MNYLINQQPNLTNKTNTDCDARLDRGTGFHSNTRPKINITSGSIAVVPIPVLFPLNFSTFPFLLFLSGLAIANSVNNSPNFLRNAPSLIPLQNLQHSYVVSQYHLYSY